MITSCIIFLASFSTPEVSTPVINETQYIQEYISCSRYVPKSMHQHADLYYEFFEKENISTAIRIGWCESRGKETAYRDDNGDSGLMQFVSWTWNWIAEEHDLPMWDEWVILKNGRPYTENKVSKSDIGFEQIQVQFSPYYNIYFASILAQDMYGRTQWRDWKSSKFCWGNPKKFQNKWTNEN